ncbi:hypothetical protein BH09VER1_BH09VER1_28150 [soil metagenome]
MPPILTQPAVPPPTGEPDPALRCGTLQYTRASLFTLCAWLIWGDFCFSLMENVWPSILPLMLKREGASNFILSLIVTTIPSIMNFVLNPIISTASDRYRSPRGRRTPFLLFATPFATVLLILLGFSQPIGHWLHTLLPGYSPQAIVLTTVGLLVIGFRFFELFVNTVFWYLFNDVVPTAYMGRALGLFRVAGSLAGAAFNFFLFKHAETHTSAIFFGVALLYGTMFFLMALNVKEGSYPPPAPREAPGLSWWLHVKAFFKECFSHRIYRLVFTYNALYYAASVVNTFLLFLALSLGLTLEQFGFISGAAALLSVLLMIPIGALIDRFNPIRLMLLAQLGCALAYSVKLLFLFIDFPPSVAFWIFAAAVIIVIPMTVANTMAGLPMLMRIFPRERFGQFCSANAMCGAAGTVLGSLIASNLLDYSRPLFHAANDSYRLIPLWSVLFTLLAVTFTWLVWREWQKLGGEHSYRPPR